MATNIATLPSSNPFFTTDDVVTKAQLEEYDASLINKRTCSICSVEKKIADFPLATPFRKSDMCSVCSLLKKKGFKCMPKRDSFASEHGEKTPASPTRATRRTSLPNLPNLPSLPSPAITKSIVKRLSWNSAPEPQFGFQTSGDRTNVTQVTYDNTQARVIASPNAPVRPVRRSSLPSMLSWPSTAAPPNMVPSEAGQYV